jgi:exonuclease SbcC
MILTHIHLVNFKKYKKASISLNNSLIGIFGNNGAGKSSLFEAITWCLYGVAQSMEGREGVKQKDLIRDGEEEMGVEVEFVLEGHTYKVSRYLNAKRGVKSRLHIDGKLQARKSREVVSRIEQDIGLNVKGFISSSFIRQKELDLITSKIASERKRLINRLFNLRVYEKFEELSKNKKREKENNLQAVQMQIKEKEKDIENLPELEKALEELEEIVKTLKSQYDAVREESETVKKRYNVLEKNYETHQKLHSTLKVMEKDSENTENGLKEKRENLKEIEKAESKKEALKPEYENFLNLKKRFSLLDAVKTKYDSKTAERQTLQTEITITEKNLTERIRELEKEVEELEEEKEGLKESRTILKTIREKITDLEAVPQQKEKETEKINKIREKEAELLAEKAKYESRIADLRKELEEIQSIGVGAPCPKCKRPLEKSHLDELTAKYGTEISVNEKVKEKYELKRKHLSEMRKELDLSIESLKKKENDLKMLKEEEQTYVKVELRIKDIQERIRGKRTKITENNEKLKELDERRKEIVELEKEIRVLGFDPSKYEEMKKEVNKKAGLEREMIELETRISQKKDIVKSIEESKKRLHILKDEICKVGTELKELANVPERFDAIKEKKEHIVQEELKILREYTEKKTFYSERRKEIQRLNEMKDKIRRTKKDQKGIQNAILIYGVLQDAFKQIPVQIQSRLQPRIRKETSELLNEVTEGKYPFINLEKDYSLTVYYDGEYYPISRFSGGEKDLINLCLRVGISRVLVSLSSQKSFARIQSLFLDECFGSFDIERRKNLLVALAQLRKYFAQIILITHIEEVKEALPEAFFVEEGEDGSSVIRKIK